MIIFNLSNGGISMNKKNRIAELRKAHGFSQSRLAKMMGVAQNTISNWEQGTRTPDYVSLKKLAYYLDCTVDYLMGNTPFGRTFVFSSADSDEFINYADEKLTASELHTLQTLLGILYENAVNIPEDIPPHDEIDTATLLLHYYFKLNDDGRRELVKRTQELSYVPKYTNSD